MVETNYYAKKLHAEKLYQVYQTGLGRVKQYFHAELQFVYQELTGQEKVLELGAGYGRIMKELAPRVSSITGIDISEDSVAFGTEYLKDEPKCRLIVKDVQQMHFDDEFDVVLCLQNGISAMKMEALGLIQQTMEMLVDGGKAYFSSYSPKFWHFRLAWFQEQAGKGLLGEIDFEKTKDGIICCKDGFVANTYTQEDLERLAKAVGYPYRIQEVDNSSIFLVIEKKR